MSVDISTELLKKITELFDGKMDADTVISMLRRRAEQGVSSFADANRFSTRCGDHLSDALLEILTADALPDGTLFYNIAQRAIAPALSAGYGEVADYTVQTMNAACKKVNFGYNAVTPAVDADRVHGIIDVASNAEDLDAARKMLGEPVINLMQSAVADVIRENADLQAKIGRPPMITRVSTGRCCDWCSGLVGKYAYDKRPSDIFKRHQYCRCQVLYEPGDGRVQDAHSKKTFSDAAAARKEHAQLLASKETAQALFTQVLTTKDAGKITSYLIRNADVLGTYTPAQFAMKLRAVGYNIGPLSNGELQGKLFSEGGGWKANLSSQDLIMYHPAWRSHHGQAYYKVSNGKDGTHRYGLTGKEFS